jgi:hypothetical protein
MTTINPDSGNNPGLPSRKSVSLCQDDAVKLHGLIYALDHLMNEVAPDNLALVSSMHSLCMIARDLSGQLANDLDGVAA